MSSSHTKEVDAGYRAWVEGVKEGKGLIELVADIVRAVDQHRANAEHQRKIQSK